MKEGLAGLAEQPTDKSSDGDLSTCNALEVEETGNVTPLPADGADRDKTRSSMSREAAASKRQRLLWIAGIVTILVLAGGVAAIAVLATDNKTSDSQVNNSSKFDFTDVPPESNNPGPTIAPTVIKAPPTSFRPTGFPTLSPTVLSSTKPSPSPTSPAPTPALSNSPTLAPAIPTIEPTMQPGNEPPFQALNHSSETFAIFCAIADVPYLDSDIPVLPVQIATQMDGCEFLVHLGDIMEGDTPCTEDRYLLVKDILLASPIPTFIVPGDNEWNDCGNNAMIDLAWSQWENNFMQLENNWNLTFPVVRNLVRPENFYFVLKRTLIFGLNIVGGRVHNATEWHDRLTSSVEWVKQVVELFVPASASGVVILAQAQLSDDHMDFFDPLRRLVRDDWNNELPFLYLHGDGHAYRYKPGFLNQPNLLAIQHEGGVRNPILKIQMDPYGNGPHATNAFQVDRQL